MKIDELVGKYIQLRDKKAEMDAEHKARVAKVVEALDKIESVLLKEFQASGMDSVKTSAGTAYTQTRMSATVADWDIALKFIRDHDAYDMLEKRVAKSAVENYIEETGTPPPGVNIRQEIVVNVRRS